MPPAVGLVAAAAGAAVAGSTAAIAAFGTLGASLLGSVVATGLNFVGSRALAKKPKAPQFSADASGRALVVRSSVESHKIIYGQARVSGPLVFIKTINTGVNSALQGVSGDNKFLHMVVALAGHEVDGIGQIYLNDQPVTLDPQGFVIERPYARILPGEEGVSYVRITKHLGAADQAADPNFINELGLTSAHRLRGIAYLYLRLEYNANVFPQGIPNVSAVVSGKKLFDPRTGLTRWSDNAALCVRDYLISDYGFGCASDEIDDTYFTAATNLSDEAVALKAGGTQARYTCNGVVDTATAPLDNLSGLLTSLAGAVTYVQGKFRLHGAAYETPAGDIPIDILLGGVKFDGRPSRKELFNAVKGTYVDPSKQWQPTDFPPVTNSTYAAEDGGEQIFKDIELPFTTHPERAQRLAKIILEKGRQGIRVTIPVDHTALQFSAYDVVTLTNEQLGWNAKPFRILKWSLNPPGPILLHLQEESEGSYDWDAGAATTIDDAPDTNLPLPWLIAPPGALTVTESKYVTRAGDGVKAKATLTWGASSDGFLRDYQAEYRPMGAEAWQPLPKTVAATQDIEDIAPGIYDFRVKALNQLGVSSAYSTASKQINGLLDAPTEPQNLTISTIGGLAILRWDEFTGNDSLDVKIGGKVVFRHSPDTGAAWHQSTTIGNAEPGSSTTAILPLKAGIYLAKAVDSSGIESEGHAGVSTAQATALEYANVDSLTEHPTFGGTKTNCLVDGLDNLRLTAGGNFSTIPLVSAVPSIGTYGGISAGGTYEFSGVIDLGSVKRVRITSHVVAEIINQLDTIRSRTAPMSTWKSFSGGGAAEADARVYLRTTEDDPSGSPTWGDYHRLDSGEFVCRGIDPQLRLESFDPAYNVLVSELSITVDEVA